MIRFAHLRYAGALAGLFAWLLLPFAVGAAQHARWDARCGSRVFTGAMDDCFNDYIPVAEIFGTLLIWALGAVFWGFAKRLFSVASIGDASDEAKIHAPDWLTWHFLGGIGVVWSVWNFLGVPFNLKYYFPLMFWFGFTLWFFVGIAVSARPLWQIGPRRPASG